MEKGRKERAVLSSSDPPSLASRARARVSFPEKNQEDVSIPAGSQRDYKGYVNDLIAGFT